MNFRRGHLQFYVLALILALGAVSVVFAQSSRPPPPVDPPPPAPTLPPFTSPVVETYAPLDTSNRVQVRNAYRQYATAMPPMQWTGSVVWNGLVATCDPGTVSTAFKNWTISRVNFHRALAGLPGNITLNEDTNDNKSANAQQAALMFTANTQLSHTPPEGWACWTTEGAAAAGYSNIALGVGASTLDDVVPRYIDDVGTNNPEAGHRRWILYPPQSAMGVGSTPTSDTQWGGNALTVLTDFGTRPPTPDGTPWPPRGFVPLSTFPVSKRWSFSYPGAGFAFANVGMTADGTPVPLTVISRTATGFGDNTIVWEVAGTVTKGVLYSISVTGVTGAGVPTTFAYSVRPFDPADPIHVRTDFNGDGKSDILWRNLATGDNAIFQLNGFTLTDSRLIGSINSAWSVVGIGDFNGDGKSDILWRNASTGENAIFQMDGFTLANSALIGSIDPAWSVAGVDDFDGDGKADILWRNATTGDNAIFLMNGFTLTDSRLILGINTAWHVVGVGDFDGDGKADILWRNPTTGDNAIFVMNGFTLNNSRLIGGINPAWNVVGVGDFDGDGKADILWRNPTTGDNAIFQMNGFTLTDSRLILGINPAWNVVGVGDYDGDGKTDILWRNSATGDNAIFLMNGFTLTDSRLIGGINPAWNVVGQ